MLRGIHVNKTLIYILKKINMAQKEMLEAFEALLSKKRNESAVLRHPCNVYSAPGIEDDGNSARTVSPSMVRLVRSGRIGFRVQYKCSLMEIDVHLFVEIGVRDGTEAQKHS